MPISLTHGFFAASGLTLLILFTTGEPIHSTLTSIVLFSIAAIGGVVLFARDMMNKSLPKSLVLVHASIAILSFAILLVAAFS